MLPLVQQWLCPYTLLEFRKNLWVLINQKEEDKGSTKEINTIQQSRLTFMIGVCVGQIGRVEKIQPTTNPPTYIQKWWVS